MRTTDGGGPAGDYRIGYWGCTDSFVLSFEDVAIIKQNRNFFLRGVVADIRGPVPRPITTPCTVIYTK